MLERPKIPEELPVLPLREIVIFPNLVAPLPVPRYLSKLIDETLARDKLLCVVTQKNPEVEEPQPKDLYKVGTAVFITKMFRFPDGTIRLLIQGISRVKILKYTPSPENPLYIKARVQEVKESQKKDIATQALMRNIVNMFHQLIDLAPYMPEELRPLAMNIDEPGKLADFVASYVNFDFTEKQSLLETFDPKERLSKLTPLLSKEISILELGAKIRSQVKTELDKSQREFYLREQLKAIRKELGEEDERTVEIKELREKIEKANLPEEPRKVALKELDRLSRMPPQAAEYTVSRTYIDWLITLPWSKSTEDNLDIKRAQKILDEDHYDLDKVKERIIEYLAVKKLKKDSKGPILCFVGPPGVGKTSLGRSIARALGRKFVRVSLGGVRDEAEIRGHRRTYVGALPGRIIQSIKNAGSNNPVFMLDEIDKVGQDFRGDPSSALLEVLDPEQNTSFSDHYLEIPFDLSKVMFITTANLVDPILPALRDRMEILELPGYIEEEKLHIAKKFLIPRQIKEAGLRDKDVEFKDEAISLIIREYTREAGVRNLERECGSIIRKIAKRFAEGKRRRVEITPKRVREFLGPPKYFSEVALRKGEIGVATGLVWTPVGGEIVFIESTKMRGKKNLLLTGQLGEVMKESAQAALSYIRSKAKSFGISEDFFDKYDIHIHVPQGAVPKDGPSAGITIATSLLSLLKEKPINPEIAMTGEITLAGRVLPVGGIKEKVLGAKRAGIKTVIMPKENKKDLEEIPEKIRKGLEFKFVQTIDDVFKLVFNHKR